LNVRILRLYNTWGQGNESAVIDILNNQKGPKERIRLEKTGEINNNLPNKINLIFGRKLTKNKRLVREYSLNQESEKKK